MNTIPSSNILFRIKNKIIRSYTSYKKHIHYFFKSRKIPISKSNDNVCPKSPLITIFGSCRQDSIYELFKVTSIKNDLTYPHYTKEIIQAIEFCKESSTNFDEPVFFRSSLLKKRIIKKNFLKEFKNTDLFVVEIASRICYKYKDRYIHHEAFDNPTFNKILNGHVDIYDLTDEEIEQDIIEIRDLIHPKKLIVVTHIATTRKGRRFDLVNLIKNICGKLDITVIDPYEVIKHYPQDLLFERNDNERHYTDYGHKIIKSEYEKVINLELQNNKKKLIQVYSNSEDRTKEHSYQGFGDFLIGAVSINQFARKLGFIPKASFNNHPISNFFYNREHVSPVESKNTKYIFESPELIDFVEGGIFFTHKKPKKITPEDKKFIIYNCLQPRINFEKYIKKILEKIELGDDYRIIHVRGPDEDLITTNFIEQVNQLIKKHTQTGYIYLLLSNSEKILNGVTSKNIKKTGLLRCHSGLSKIKENELRDTLLEFILMTRSKEILQLSIYPWGSNFSNIVAELYDIPINRKKLSEI